MSLLNRWIAIQSFKHDGTFHRFWDRGLVLEDNTDFIIVATKKAKVTESTGRKWFTKEPAVTIFFKKEWYNVICMFKNNGISYYCNLASPCIVENACIKYIDYDLDVKMTTEKSIKLLDEKEYERHREQYHYSDDLDYILKHEMNSVVELMKKGTFPFNDELVKKNYNKLLNYFSRD